MGLARPRAPRRIALATLASLATLVTAAAFGVPRRGGPAAPAGADEGALAAQAVAAHARVRAQVGVAPLRWSPSLAAYARDWAQQLCRGSHGGRAVLRHRPHNRYGENLHWQGGGSAPSIDDAVASWASERQYFDQARGACRGGECGHYTQLVWRNTTEVGCGTATCGAHHFWVCNYDPPGNWVGQRPY